MPSSAKEVDPTNYKNTIQKANDESIQLSKYSANEQNIIEE